MSMSEYERLGQVAWSCDRHRPIRQRLGAGLVCGGGGGVEPL